MIYQPCRGGDKVGLVKVTLVLPVRMRDALSLSSENSTSLILPVGAFRTKSPWKVTGFVLPPYV